MLELGSGRTVLRAAVVALLCGALSAVWELFARQAPGSPFYLGILPGPVILLRELCVTLGLLLLGAGLLLRWAFGGPPPRWIVVALCGGSALAIGAQLYGALSGMYGVQVRDLRPDALPMFITKHAGLLAVIVALVEVGRRVLTRPAPS